VAARLKGRGCGDVICVFLERGRENGMYTRMYACVCMYMYIYIYTFIYTYIYTYVCICMYMYVYVALHLCFFGERKRK